MLLRASGGVKVVCAGAECVYASGVWRYLVFSMEEGQFCWYSGV